MFVKHYVFDNPPILDGKPLPADLDDIPLAPEGPQGIDSLLAVEERYPEGFVLVARAVTSGKPIIRKSKGTRGYLLDGVCSGVKYAEEGRVVIATQTCIVVPGNDGAIYKRWDTSDWQLEE